MQKKAQQAMALKQEAAKLKQTQAQLAPAMKQAKASVKDQLLPKNHKRAFIIWFRPTRWFWEQI